MAGKNLAISQEYLNESKIKLFSLEGVEKNKAPCIFISYQREDEEYANEVADYIIDADVNVYFDSYDESLYFPNNNIGHKEVTNSIRNGLDKSNYMLVIISPSTFDSFWVPFEIGYAYDKLEDKIDILRHKAIDDIRLPSYLKLARVLQGYESLDGFLKSIKRRYKINESVAKTFSRKIHPLAEYLDKA